jgi:hypothetical protein
MNKTLLEILDKEKWEVGLAAWIFAGYSPLKKQQTGMIVRLADEEEFAFGSFEYREAEKAKNAIMDLLAERIMESNGVSYISTTFPFDRNWLVSVATVATNEHPVTYEEHYIDVWWANWACKKHYLPAYIAPELLSDKERKERGSFSWRRPSSEQILELRIHGQWKFGPGNYTRVPGSLRGPVKLKIMPLFQEGAVRVSHQDIFDPDSNKKFCVYEFFQDTIRGQSSVMAEKQAVIEDVEKHSMPRPTAAVARDLIIKEARKKLEADPNWGWVVGKRARVVGKKAHGGGLEWYYNRPENTAGQPMPQERYTLSMAGLNSRIIDWFIKTEAGVAYDEYFHLNWDKYFKPPKE